MQVLSDAPKLQYLKVATCAKIKLNIYWSYVYLVIQLFYTKYMHLHGSIMFKVDGARETI